MRLFDDFQKTLKDIIDSARSQGRLLHNPAPELLRRLALEEENVRETAYASLVALTEPMSRAKQFTKNNIDDAFGEPEAAMLQAAKEYFSSQEIVCLDVMVRRAPQGEVTARLIVPRSQAHLAYGGSKLFGPVAHGISDPTYQMLFYFDEAFSQNAQKTLPQKDISIRCAFSSEGRMIKLVRNSNYLGEWKKGVFTAENFRAKLEGRGIFLHSGCRLDLLETPSGGKKRVSTLLIALSANGKTSLTGKTLARKSGEESWLIQDDGGILGQDGSFEGFELGGVYVKTDGLGPADQIEIYYAALKPTAYLENVHVDPEGNLDFFNIERTSNGRAVVERRDCMHAHPRIKAPKVDNIILISRGGIVPAAAKLSPAQAVAFMVLGQSMESSAGDPTQAGKIKNVFFYDPFIAGDRVSHAHLFYDILKQNPEINCYLLNTGGVGEGKHYRDIKLSDTLGILDAILRGRIENWSLCEASGLTVPSSVPGVDSIVFHPEKLYQPDKFEEKRLALFKSRMEILNSYPSLAPEIRSAITR